MFGSTKNHRT